MQSVAIALSLCALLGCGLASLPSTPTNPAETYTFKYREPSGCTLDGGNCTYFVGIQLNAGDSKYLDFYLEGVAVAWVAIGFSTTNNMFDADVLGCVRIDPNVAAVDTWNVASPGRTNVLDDPQTDIIEHAASFTNGANGRITCNFTRLIAITNVGQDLNLLAQDYWHLYGRGQNAITMGALPRGFNSHLPGNPTVSGTVMDLGITIPPPGPSDPTVPTTRPENYCYNYSEPDGCTLAAGNCNYYVAIQENENNHNYLDFYLEGVAAAWVAIGFSTTANMFDADVLGCVVVGTEVRAVDTWNVAQASGRNNVLDDTQNDIIQFAASSTSGRITCSFTRKVAVTNVGQDLNLLAQDYWLLYGRGQNAIETGVLPRAFNTHRPQNNPTVSSAVVNLGLIPTEPTNPPEDYYYTYRQPDGCTLATGDCTYFVAIQKNEGSSKYLDFYLVGVAVAWVAIGFSTTANMFDADVLGCVVVGTEVMAVDTWNVAQASGRNNLLDDNQYGITQFEASSTDGRITCSFARKVAVTNEGQDLDLLAQEYWLLYGLGQNAIETGDLPRAFNTHRPQNNPTVSDTVVDISSGQAVRALSLLMITTMSVIAVTAAFFAA